MKKQIRCPRCGRTEGLRTFFHAEGEVIVRGNIEKDGAIDLPPTLNRAVGGDVLLCYEYEYGDITLSFRPNDSLSPDVYCTACNILFDIPKGIKTKCRIID
jgi:hypothetical protein